MDCSKLLYLIYVCMVLYACISRLRNEFIRIPHVESRLESELVDTTIATTVRPKLTRCVHINENRGYSLEGQHL